MTKVNPAKRRKARQYALQAIYQWQVSGTQMGELELQFLESINSKKVDVEYFRDLLSGTLTQLSAIDNAITPFLDRELERVDPVERAILRLGTYELLAHLEIPYRVVINEALELAKVFGATEGHKFVNGILDKTAQQLRKLEFQARK